MRLHGEISEWRDDRGFGFITPVGGGGRVFVHVSAFDRGKRPRQGDQVTYEVVSDGPKGARAVQVRFSGSVTRKSSRATTGRWALQAAMLALLVGAGILYSQRTGLNLTPAASGSVRNEVSQATFKCSGKRKCSEMTSCEEAKFYLANCPGVEIDGDGDGIPCESQWCGY